MRATDAALTTALWVTFTGSMMPCSMRLPYSSVAALKPSPFGISATLDTTTAPSRPALSAIQNAGLDSARATASTPVFCSPSKPSAKASSCLAICTSAEPPPAMMPSSAAARAALMASSTRSLRSFCSVSVAAPTRSTATPPDSLARRSSAFSLSQVESVDSISRRIWLRRSSTASAVPAPSTMTVSSLVTVTRRAEPRCSRVASLRLTPTSGSITVAAVTTARSSINALRRSPKYGDFTATTLRILRMELTTSACSASPSMSSATTNSGTDSEAACSRSGRKSGREEILPRTSSTRAFSSTAWPASGSVMKYGERKPLSKEMPSVRSTYESMDWDSSTVSTPSLPTLSIAPATISPTSGSREDTVATFAISAEDCTSVARALSSSTTFSAAALMPLFSSIGFAPAATLRRPSATSAWARSVAVVVPSPAMSFVFTATDFTNCAPRFSNGSSRSMSRAMVTPSLVTVGPPQDLDSTTLRPRGPRVTFTASASVSTPRWIPSRAS